MNKIIFCNDYLQMPLVQTTAAVLNDENLSDYDKKFIGFFGGMYLIALDIRKVRKLHLRNLVLRLQGIILLII